MKQLFLKIAICILAMLGPSAAFAHEFKVGEIEIDHPHARAMLPGAKVGGGYLAIVNHGADDRLVSASSARSASVQIHEMKHDGDIMVMRELKDGIAIPADSTVELKPGGYHLMFVNVTRPFKEGEMVSATLTFEKAGSVDVEFTVGPASGGAQKTKQDAHTGSGGDHGGMPAMAAPSGDQ